MRKGLLQKGEWVTVERQGLSCRVERSRRWLLWRRPGFAFQLTGSRLSPVTFRWAGFRVDRFHPANEARELFRPGGRVGDTTATLSTTIELDEARPHEEWTALLRAEAPVLLAAMVEASPRRAHAIEAIRHHDWVHGVGTSYRSGQRAFIEAWFGSMDVRVDLTASFPRGTEPSVTEWFASVALDR
jgi:hypothetical protein